MIDNPAAWNAGPGITVTSSTRSLLSGRAPRTERSTARSAEDGQGKSRACEAAGSRSGEAPPQTGPMDDLDAQFVWRSLLQLDSDEEFEDEHPTRFPGFINEPIWSSVYETLMQQTAEDYETMRAALPRCMHMI